MGMTSFCWDGIGVKWWGYASNRAYVADKSIKPHGQPRHRAAQAGRRRLRRMEGIWVMDLERSGFGSNLSATAATARLPPLKGMAVLAVVLPKGVLAVLAVLAVRVTF